MKYNRVMKSSRCDFQYKYAELAPDPARPGEDEPNILNIGSANDPLGFGVFARHVDMDDWSYAHVFFTQADAAKLPFPDKSYHTVILGDIMEHAMDPKTVSEEATRVAREVLVFTVFEEWELPGHGQFIKEGQANSDIESRKLGYADREDYQRKVYPLRIGVPDDEVPHLIHINQFNDKDMENMAGAIVAAGFEAIELLKVPEAVYEGHEWSNWLLAFRRVK